MKPKIFECAGLRGDKVKEHLANLLEELSLLDGLPGQEQPVVRYLKDRLEPFAEEVHIGSTATSTPGRRGAGRA